MVQWLQIHFSGEEKVIHGDDDRLVVQHGSTWGRLSWGAWADMGNIAASVRENIGRRLYSVVTMCFDE